MADQLQQNDISQFSKGLHLDNSMVDSPKGSYRFALNSVNETELGDSGFIGNEESNEIYTNLTPGFIPIGKCYMGKNETAILSVSTDNSISEIGIMDDSGNYTPYVNDAGVTITKDKLGFRIEQQIQVTYRLRRGCERTIYFTGKGYPPRYFNFDKLDQFKRGIAWSAPKFNLYKKIETFPTIDSVQVLDSSGALIPGSYSILVQHLDEDLNGTEFYELVRDINIYNDALDKNFSDIQGSSNIGTDVNPYKYGKTNKAIRISLDAVDRNFTYIRFAFAERTSGTGLVSRVRYSDPISVFNPVFTYTGDNASSEGTIEEVELFNINAGIQTAEHIEQVDNMLILANVSGDQSKVCKLQKYASRIKTDCFVKDIILTTNKEAHNPKNPLVVQNGLTYQPGEIYSLGIVYVFEDYSVSPVCHIPGKSLSVDKSMVYSPGTNVYPMSNVNNQNSSEIYLDNDVCGSDTFWGLDSEGDPLTNKNVRHHRLPTRDEIGVGFVKRTSTSGDIVTYKRLQLNLTGVLKKSDTTIPYVAPNFTLIVRYKRNGVVESFQDSTFPDSNIFNPLVSSNVFLDTDVITDIKLFYLEEGSSTEVEIPLTNGESVEQDNGLIYKVFSANLTENNVSHIYTVPILGLKFSDIELPPEDEIGKKIIGYQIVRQERREIDKTILDSAVVFPMLKSGRNVTTGMLGPEYFNGVTVDGLAAHSQCEGSEDGNNPTCYNVSKRNIMLLTPGHKFMDKTYDGFTTIEQVGSFEIEYRARNVFSLQNVYDGTSASGEEDKKTDDDDGFSLRHATRFAGVKYKTANPASKYIFDNENTRMYNLEAVNYAEAEDNNETLYNLSCDNKALILSSTKPGVDMRTYRPGKDEFPYVYIKKNSQTFYQNFRNNPYYLIDTQVFNTNTAQVFGGDTYIAPLRYSNHIFGNVAVATRRKKMSVWALIGSIVIALIGIALAIFSGGSSLVLAGGIIVALGAVATGAATIIETAKFNEIYRDRWEKNLDRTVFDYFYASLFIKEYPEKTWEDYLHWEDDTFRWMGDGVGDLWFETPLNISLRVPPMNMENNYLKPLKAYPPDRPDRWFSLTLGHGVDYVGGGGIGSGDNFYRFADPVFPVENEYEQYFLGKISKPEPGRTSGVLYTGISVPQVYLINPDHYVTTGIKKYYTIPLEYDCCSKCQECFPHRIHYSQQSFQEEKADNYRMFLPNNYRDIEGETGEITNIFRLYNNLYAHTKEALWEMGRNYKERVTDNVVSFIGTGEYFEIPPQKVLDDDTGSSAGTRHKWGSIKTPSGYFFVSENQRKIYRFTGKNIEPISDLGLTNWFRNNLEVQLDKEFLNTKGEEYPNSNNPSNPLGTGFISTYDTRKERIIFTKRDIKLSGSLYQNDTQFCVNGDTVTIFPDMSQTILQQSNLGWSYLGIENCSLKFFKDVVKSRTEIRDVTTTISNSADIIVWLDTSGSFTEPARQVIKDAINSWKANYISDNPQWVGNLQFVEAPGPGGGQTEWWLDSLRYVKDTLYSGDVTGKDIIIVSFVNEAQPDYHGNAYTDFIDSPHPLYSVHLNNFRPIYEQTNSFYGLAYPILFGGSQADPTNEFLKHTLAAVKGVSYTQAEVDALIPNPLSLDWNKMKTALKGNNPYDDYGLENYGWKVKTNRFYSGSGDIISAEDFQLDMTEFLQGITTTTQVEVIVNYVEREYKYLDGVTMPLEEVLQNDNSWTISFSLRNNSWTSWHSYLPNFYINVPEKFYSWKYGNSSIWKHSKIGEYQTFYGEYYPHIVEHVSVENPITTKIWNHILLQTEAKLYDFDLKEYSDVRDVTFNKAILYNTRQCSGEMDLIVKDTDLGGTNYMMNQVINTNNNHSIIDRTERDWIINDFRDIRIDYTKPIWNSNSDAIQSKYYIDKVLNESTLDINKNWTDLESFRDKYLVVRLIFDNFADKKLITNFSVENEQMSSH